MKTLTVREAEDKLAQLIVEANEGELIVLKAGELEVTLHPGGALDLEKDTPALEAELLKAVRGPHAPLLEAELREMADRALQEHRTKRHS
jgi:antitoxin (DNA-binding transcriptional repressor) of toxin-antitoxin stability system